MDSHFISFYLITTLIAFIIFQIIAWKNGHDLIVKLVFRDYLLAIIWPVILSCYLISVIMDWYEERSSSEFLNFVLIKGKKKN